MAHISELTDVATVVEVMEVEDAFKGKRFSITGHISINRDRFIQIVEKAGGVFDKAPTYGTTYLVTNSDWTPGSTVGAKSKKFEKAQKLGIRILSEKKFFDMLVAAGKTCADEW